MTIRLLVVAFTLCISAKIGDARTIPGCNPICFNNPDPTRCCGSDQKDIPEKQNYTLQESNSTYTNLFRQKRSAWPTAYISHTLHNGFTDEEGTVVRNAMQVLVNRLFTPRVRDCMYRKTGNSGYNIAAGVYSSSNLDEDRNYNGYKDLLRFQLDCLELKSVRQTFPLVNIRPWHEQSETVGKGTIGCVTIASRGSNFIATGEFNLWLNRYQLAAPTSIGFDSNYWAGVIAHEMLHNLGHSHDDYSDGWQINAFQRCLVSDGSSS